MNPRRLGRALDEVPVLSADDFTPAADAFLLVAVGRPGGREEVRTHLRLAGLDEEHDFLCVQ